MPDVSVQPPIRSNAYETFDGASHTTHNLLVPLMAARPCVALRRLISSDTGIRIWLQAPKALAYRQRDICPGSRELKPGWPLVAGRVAHASLKWVHGVACIQAAAQKQGASC